MFDSLPVLRVFDDLKVTDKVYSKKLGLGHIISIYSNDEIMVQFADLRKRISVFDEEVSKITEAHLINKIPNKRIEVFMGDEKMTFTEFKKRRMIERERERIENSIKKMKKKSLK